MEMVEVNPEALISFKVITDTDTDGSFRVFVKDTHGDLVAHSRFTLINNVGEVPEGLEKLFDEKTCNAFSSNIGVVEKFRKKGIGKAIYLLSLKKLVNTNNERVMELVQDESKRKSGDTMWEDTKRKELDEELFNSGVKSRIL